MSYSSRSSSDSASSDSPNQTPSPTTSPSYTAPPSPCLPTHPASTSFPFHTSNVNRNENHHITTITCLPSLIFANPTFLRDLAASLLNGAGDLVVLCSDHLNNQNVKSSSERVTGEVGVDIKYDHERGRSGTEVDWDWVEVTGNVDSKQVPYFVSSTTRCDVQRGIQDVVKSVAGLLCDLKWVGDQGHLILTHAELLNLLSLTSFRCIVSLLLPHHSHNNNNPITINIIERPTFSFPPLVPSLSLPASMSNSEIMMDRRTSTRFGVPTRSEWHDLWKAWDLVTLGMIPPSMLHQKPIDLRHKCLFYIGHIPTFLDMLMSKALGEPNTEPQNYTTIFERGIDPHVDDPEHCHSHSEVPEVDEDWPTLEDIIGFRDRVRARLMRLYDDLSSGKRIITRTLARMLVMTLEHEGFHVETLLYMLMQRAGTGTISPPGFTTPPWSSLSDQWARLTPPLVSSTTTLGPTTVILGHDDSEADDVLPDFIHDIDGHEFGWDNESPQRTVEVGQFKIDWRPVSNVEFYTFWRGEGRGQVEMPKSWVDEEEQIKIRTLYGSVSMEIAKDWPVLTSYDDLLLYAKHKGGRIPTEPELRLFFDTYEVGHDGGANVGFRNWHPIPATTGGDDNGGRGSNGGVWEWTMTTFAGHEGLVPTNQFTGYSTDFFDDKHHVVLGASYATIPRLASRNTLRNFYQHNYPYPWVGARVAYDI